MSDQGIIGPAPDADLSTFSIRTVQRTPSPGGSPIHRFRKFPATPEQVLKSFNTRSFKREQPYNLPLMLSVIARAIAAKEPIPFVMYWGKGLRPLLAAPEYACLNYLASMLQRVSQVYEPGAKMSLLFTDTHASLNGHSPQSIASYYADFCDAVGSRGFEPYKLSSFLKPADIEALSTTAANEQPSAQLMADLAVSAAKWFKGEGTPEEGALRYYRANMVERRAVEAHFPNSIFVTFNGSSLRSIFPESLPIFYMYSVRHGISDKPWFLPPDYVIKVDQANIKLDLQQAP